MSLPLLKNEQEELDKFDQIVYERLGFAIYALTGVFDSVKYDIRTIHKYRLVPVSRTVVTRVDSSIFTFSVRVYFPQLQFKGFINKRYKDKEEQQECIFQVKELFHFVDLLSDKQGVECDDLEIAKIKVREAEYIELYSKYHSNLNILK